MSLATLLYASSACLPAGERDAHLAQLVHHAVAANSRMNVTGALMHCATRFVELLEGPPEVLDPLVTRIAADTRHTDMITLLRKPITERRFTTFALVYNGNSVFVSRNISRPLAQAKRGSEVETHDLVQMMIEFSR